MLSLVAVPLRQRGPQDEARQVPRTCRATGAVTQKAAGGREKKVAWPHNVKGVAAFILP